MIACTSLNAVLFIMEWNFTYNPFSTIIIFLEEEGRMERNRKDVQVVP